MIRSRATIGLGLGVLASACGSDLGLVLERKWGAGDPIVVVAVDVNGLARAMYLPPATVQRFDFSLVDDLAALYVRSYPVLLEYEPFEGCTVSLGDANGTPIAADGFWRSKDIEGDGLVSLEVEAEPRSFDLRLLGCARRMVPCELGITPLQAPPIRTTLRSSVALPGGRLIAGGGARALGDARSDLLYVDESGPRVLGPYDEVTFDAAGFALRGDRVIGAAHDRLFELDTSGNFVRSSTLSFIASRLVGGADGSIGLIGSRGEIAIIPADREELVALAPPPYAPAEIEAPRLALRSPDSVLVIGPEGRLYLWEGGRWRQQFVQADSFDGIGASADAFVVLPTRYSIQRRVGTGDWMPLGSPMALNNLSTSVPLDADRFLFAGQGGQLLYWNGEAMCFVASGTTRNLESLAREVGSRTVWAVGEQDSTTDMRPVVLRLELPP